VEETRRRSSRGNGASVGSSASTSSRSGAPTTHTDRHSVAHPPHHYPSTTNTAQYTSAPPPPPGQVEAAQPLLQQHHHQTPVVDPLQLWIQHRAQDFRDFDNSLSAPNSLHFAAAASADADPFFVQPSAFFSTLQPSSRRRLPTAIAQDPFSVSSEQHPYQYPVTHLQTNHRTMDDKELSPRARVTIDEDKLQVEFNVKDYKPEELSLKTEGDVLVVLGKQEVKEGGQTFVSKQFEQRFSLPSGARPDNISSALSKDGVLTVTALRDPPAIKGRSKPAIEGSGQQVFQASQQTKRDGLPHPRVKYDDDKFQICLDAQQYKPDELDVKVEGNNIIITAKQAVQEAGGTRTRVFEQKFSMPSGVQADKVSSSLTKDGVLVIDAPRGNSSANQSYTKSIENSMNKVMTPSKWEDDRPTRDTSSSSSSSTTTTTSKAFNSPLSSNLHGGGSNIFDQRPSLLDDSSFFEPRKGSLFDNEKSILAANSETNGVSRVEYDATNYKIHVNVENFLPEELVVKTIDNTVKVDAKHEEKTGDGHSYSTRSFSQSFTLPRGVNPDSISSALSKEGVLTISAPLPPALKSNANERMVPIKHN